MTYNPYWQARKKSPKARVSVARLRNSIGARAEAFGSLGSRDLGPRVYGLGLGVKGLGSRVFGLIILGAR